MKLFCRLEHRYYGDSVATEDLSTESLRFVSYRVRSLFALAANMMPPNHQLSTEQSLADCDYWVKNVQLPKLNGSIDLGTTPVIFYGGTCLSLHSIWSRRRTRTSRAELAISLDSGSYAGGQAAFMRHLYPETVYGAIASSGAIHAQIDSWRGCLGPSIVFRSTVPPF